MNSETNKILESLLKQHGITGFLPFEKPEHSEIECQLYGYVVSDKFVICNSSLNEPDITSVYGSEQRYYVIVRSNTGYSFINKSISKGDTIIVIGADKKIITESAEGLTYTSSSFMFIGEKSDILEDDSFAIFHFDHYSEFIKCDNSKYINPESQFKRLTLPKSTNSVLVRGELISNLSYLFSTKLYHFFIENMEGNNHIHIYDKQGYIISSKQMPSFLWISNNHLCIAYIESKNRENPPYKTKYIRTYACGECREAEISHDYASNDHSNFRIAANKNFLVLINGYRGYGIDYIVIGKDGEILSNQGFAGSFKEFSNNLIKLRSENYETVYDVIGNEIVHYKGIEERVIFSRTYSGPRYFADQNINDSICENIIQPKLYGVIDVRTGEVPIPAIYSDVSEYSTVKLDRENCENIYYTIDIVTITNVVNGETQKYWGAYINNILRIPIFYDEIVVPKYSVSTDNGGRREESNYIFARKDKKWVLFYMDGEQIINKQFDNLELVLPAPNRNCPISPDYVLGNSGDETDIIYKKKSISSIHKVNKAELLSVGSYWNLDYRWIKIITSLGCAVCFEGQIVSEYYQDILVNSVNDTDVTDGIVFIIKQKNNLWEIHNRKDHAIIQGEYASIFSYQSCVRLNNTFFDYKGNILFEISDEMHLISEKRTFSGDSCLVFTSPECLIFIEIYNHKTYVVKYPNEDDLEEYRFLDYTFNPDTNKFEIDEDEQNEHDSYLDDTDYDRDTYYALGGDDYDAFRERGGSIDDMMDGMGF